MLEWTNDFGPLSPKAMFLDGVDHNFVCFMSFQCGTSSVALVSKQWDLSKYWLMKKEMLDLEVEEDTLIGILPCSPEIRELLKVLQKQLGLKI